MNNSNKEILVSIRCVVYNQEPYLRQCLDGLVMQKTNFRFEAIVHDDASTDNSANIIKEYAEKYPDIIKPIYETENQYSKHDGSLSLIILNAMSKSSKYIAFCEGDDYWIDPLKLQKQVDYLESHPDCTMCCNRTKLYSEKKNQYIGENYCYNHDSIVKVKDVIYRGGLFISTCSIVLRRDVRNNYPDYCRKCAVGDYPLQIMAAMKGYIYYFNEIMSVYRVDNPNSWMSGQKWKSTSDSNLKRIDSMVSMFDGFKSDYPQHKKVFDNKIAQYISSSMPNRKYNEKGYKKFTAHFEKYISKFSLLWKIDYWLRGISLPILNLYYYYSKFLEKKYNKKVLLY